MNIVLINTKVRGNVEVKQSCSTNANCLVSSNMNAVADVLFIASNTSNAKNAMELPTAINIDHSKVKSLMSIREQIFQSSNESCNLSSLNEMNHVSIYAANSDIGGNISLDQEGSVEGTCSLGNIMSAAAYATGQSQNQAQSGKDKKGEKWGGNNILLYIVIGVVVVVIVSIVAKMISGGSKQTEKEKKEKEAEEARGKAGCPGGLQPVLDPKTQKPIIDPRTKRPVCPPYTPPPPEIKVVAPAQQPVQEVYEQEIEPQEIEPQEITEQKPVYQVPGSGEYVTYE